MKKEFIKILSIGLLITTLVSCSDWLDVNTDPNNPSEASMELVFPVGTFEVATNVGGYYNLVGGMWSQYYTQSNAANQYKYIDGYYINADDFQMQWREMYAGALSDLTYVKTKAEEAENWSMYLMATTMEVYAWQVMVDLYDQIPYSEALKGDAGAFNPKFENGKEIYADLIVKLETALAKDLSSPSSVLTTAQKKQDQVFAGDVSSWVQFANTLKLKLYLRQMYADPAVAEAGIRKLYADGAQFLNKHAMLDIFIDEKDKNNPLYSSNVTNLNVGTNLRASSTLYNFLEDKADARYASLIDKAPNGSKGVPLPQGGFEINSTVLDPVTISVFKLSPTTPVYFFTEAESYFMQAEVVAKGWGTGDAKALYDNGVLAAYDRLGLDGSTYIAAGGVYEYPATGSFEEQQEAIMMQKWVSMAGIQGLESFLETNRTHYPSVSTVAAWNGTAFGGSLNAEYKGGKLVYSMAGVSEGKKFPKRLLIPQDERAANTNMPADLKAKKVTDKVWWDTK